MCFDFIVLLQRIRSSRGDSFRKDYKRLGDIRSLVPPSCKFMALTATACKSTRVQINCSLHMRHPKLVYMPPQKKNILYCVKEKGTIEMVVKRLYVPLREINIQMPRIILFCKRYDQCSLFYRAFKVELGDFFTYPSGAPDLAKYRLVDMYTRCTDAKVKESILSSFCASGGNLRIVIATIAFGMGLDCENIREVIHWGPSSDIESYIQETGRAGRDGYLSYATLFHGPGDGKFASNEMMTYVQNTSMCRR